MTDARTDALIWAWFQAQPRDKWCAKCGRFGMRWHKHFGRCERPALPDVKPGHLRPDLHGGGPPVGRIR